MSKPSTVIFAALLCSACGGGTKVDAGTSLGGGFVAQGGGTASLGGGSATGGGEQGGGAAQEVLHFTIKDSRGEPVTGASMRLSGPHLIGGDVANDAGVITIEWAQAERPFDLTVAAAGYEAVSILGITTVLPDTLVIDPTTFAGMTANIGGTISGKAMADNPMQIDLYDGQTQNINGTSWSSQFLVDSVNPLTVVAIELDSTFVPINWAKFSQATRTDTAVTANLVLPSPANTFTQATHQLRPADAGMLDATAVSGAQVAGGLSHYTFPSGHPAGYVLAGFVTGDNATQTVNLWGIADPILVPNRLTMSLAASNQLFVNRWVTEPLTSANTTTLPLVTALSNAGDSLGNVSAQAAGVGFDTMLLQISTAFTATNTTYWRCYTAPGAPLDIAQLPTLPSNITPEMIGIDSTAAIRALPMLIKFANASTHPWQLGGGDQTNVAYSITVAGPYTQIANTWR